MPRITTYHVAPNSNGGWRVLRAGARRASKKFRDRESAISWAVEVAQGRNRGLIVHGHDKPDISKEKIK